MNEANNCFSIIFRDEYHERQNNKIKHLKECANVGLQTCKRVKYTDANPDRAKNQVIKLTNKTEQRKQYVNVNHVVHWFEHW